MTPDTYRGRALPPLLSLIRQAHGEEAIIVSLRGPSQTDDGQYEVVAAPANWHPPVERPRSTAWQKRGRYTVVLVGPPGSGKTTTVVKLALHGLAFGDRKVGLLTLDTYRVGAIEQLQVFADIAGLPLEVAYDAADVHRALEALSSCEVVIVDTPGRGMSGRTDLEWHACLAAVNADEVNLVLPAGLRYDVAMAVRRAHDRFRPTHAIFTMLDELSDAAGVVQLRSAVGLPVQWYTDGPSVPVDLRPSMSALTNGALARAG